MTLTMSCGGWGRRRDGPSWCPRHLANAAEVNVRQAHVERAEHRVRELVVTLEAAAEPAAPRREAAAGMQSARAIGGAGGCATQPCAMRWGASWRGRSKRMNSITPLA